MNPLLPAVHPFPHSLWRGQVLGSFFLENTVYPARLLKCHCSPTPAIPTAVLLAGHIWSCGGDGGSQTDGSGEMESEGENTQTEPSQCCPARIQHWRKRGMSLTAVSSKGNLVNSVCGGVTLGQPRATRNACKAETTRQKKQHNYLGWRGRGSGKAWGKGEGWGWGWEKAIWLHVLALQTWRSMKANIPVIEHP